jgi:hypothetical protein
MSLSGIASTAIAKVEAVSKTDVNSDGVIGGSTFSAGATAAGGYMAQGGGAPGAAGGSLIKKMLVGGAVGAGLGLGATFLVPGLREVTMFGLGGWAAKGVIAAIGGAIGAVGAAALHLIGQRKQNLAMQAKAQAARPQAMQPTPMPPHGVTLRMGARGPAAKKLQSDLATLGLYKGARTNAFDAATSAAVRRYEVMKGVVPTGLGSPDVRAAVAQDVQLLKQYA